MSISEEITSHADAFKYLIQTKYRTLWLMTDGIEITKIFTPAKPNILSVGKYSGQAAIQVGDGLYEYDKTATVDAIVSRIESFGNIHLIEHYGYISLDINAQGHCQLKDIAHETSDIGGYKLKDIVAEAHELYLTIRNNTYSINTANKQVSEMLTNKSFKETWLGKY